MKCRIKGCLKDRYRNSNLVTQIALERNRLDFLIKSLPFKRPPQSLRVHGFNGLSNSSALSLIQEVETKATLTAIDEKRSYILDLELKLGRQDPSDKSLDHGLVSFNKKNLNKKLLFYQECENTKWIAWPKKKNISCATVKSWESSGKSSVVSWESQKSSRKQKRKQRSKSRKLAKKEAAIRAQASYALENNLVRNLSNVEVPTYSIAVLSYGPGWIPTPSFNKDQFWIDGVNASNKQAWAAVFKDSTDEPDIPMSLLKSTFTTPCSSCLDPVVNQGGDAMRKFVENVKPRKVVGNMNRFEREGFNWIKQATKEGSIAITQADKGGCMLIVEPSLITELTSEKLLDIKRYKLLGNTDPLPTLRKELLNKWKTAVNNDYVSIRQARDTVGLIFNPTSKKVDKFTISTLDKFKPGIPYPYPLIKIHKLTEDELNTPNIIPPVRLVTDLHDGVTSRSDKFLVWSWLSSLSQDYATDLVKDSSHALIMLDKLEQEGAIAEDCLAFSLDIVQLYDTLKLNLVQEALSDAIQTCRAEWTAGFTEWFIDIVLYSFRSAVVKFQENWYGVTDGVPTGGIPSVDAANISVFYVLKKILYSRELSMSKVKHFIRFVDDGLGFYSGDLGEFNIWFDHIRTLSVTNYGLDLTMNVNPVSEYTIFLDIRFKFNNGVLTTDIYRKDTDAHRYLYYNSFHPPHTFRSIVHSQALRYRRIINNTELLEIRLNELKRFFMNSGYPEKLVVPIIDNVLTIERTLVYSEHSTSESHSTTKWVTTYGPGYNETKTVAREVNQLLKLSDTWRTSNRQNVLQVVPRRAPNLKDLTFRRKALALDEVNNTAQPCNSPRCQTCILIKNSGPLVINGTTHRTLGGNCKSFNLVYCAQCNICSLPYVGKTTDHLNIRMNGHRSKFYDILRSGNFNYADDEQILGTHLLDHHNITEKDKFNLSYNLFILAKVTPSNLRKTEQSFINKLKSLKPFGLNQVNSIF